MGLFNVLKIKKACDSHPQIKKKIIKRPKLKFTQRA